MAVQWLQSPILLGTNFEKGWNFVMQLRSCQQSCEQTQWWLSKSCSIIPKVSCWSCLPELQLKFSTEVALCSTTEQIQLRQIAYFLEVLPTAAMVAMAAILAIWCDPSYRLNRFRAHACLSNLAQLLVWLSRRRVGRVAEALEARVAQNLPRRARRESPNILLRSSQIFKICVSL